MCARVIDISITDPNNSTLFEVIQLGEISIKIGYFEYSNQIDVLNNVTFIVR